MHCRCGSQGISTRIAGMLRMHTKIDCHPRLRLDGDGSIIAQLPSKEIHPLDTLITRPLPTSNHTYTESLLRIHHVLSTSRPRPRLACRVGLCVVSSSRSSRSSRTRGALLRAHVTKSDYSNLDSTSSRLRVNSDLHAVSILLTAAAYLGTLRYFCLGRASALPLFRATFPNLLPPDPMCCKNDGGHDVKQYLRFFSLLIFAR